MCFIDNLGGGTFIMLGFDIQLDYTEFKRIVLEKKTMVAILYGWKSI